MMPGDSKQKAAAIIIAKLKPKAASSEQDPDRAEGADMDEGLLSAAEELISAVERKSPNDVARILKDFIDMCDYEPKEEGEQQNEEE